MVIAAELFSCQVSNQGMIKWRSQLLMLCGMNTCQIKLHEMSVLWMKGHQVKPSGLVMATAIWKAMGEWIHRCFTQIFFTNLIVCESSWGLNVLLSFYGSNVQCTYGKDKRLTWDCLYENLCNRIKLLKSDFLFKLFRSKVWLSIWPVSVSQTILQILLLPCIIWNSPFYKNLLAYNLHTLSTQISLWFTSTACIL